MNSFTRRIRISLLAIVLLIVAIAAVTAAPHQLEAAPIPIAPGSSISDRVRSQRDLCEVGGGSLGTATTYSSVFANVVTSVSTVCSGGTGAGWTCTNTQSTTDCKQIRVAPTQPSHTRLPEVADPRPIDSLEATPVISDQIGIDQPQVADPQRSAPTPTPASKQPTLAPTIVTDLADPEFSQEVKSDSPVPTPTPAPARPTLRPTIAPVADPRN